MTDLTQRQLWMATLAKAPLEQLEQQVAKLNQAIALLPSYEMLRPPELGLTMVQGRAGGTGQPFYLGEVPIARCVVRLMEGDRHSLTGFGYVAGRSLRHAELAAWCDALLQHPDWQEAVQNHVIKPLQREAQRQQEQQQRQTEATRVNFFTLVRGE